MSNVSYVYFVKCNVSGKVKIGKAIDINKRINDIELLNYMGVTLIYYIKIDDDLFSDMESLVHRHFAEKRLKREWFDITKKDVINFIKNHLSELVTFRYKNTLSDMIVSGKYKFIDYKIIPSLVDKNYSLIFNNNSASWFFDKSFIKPIIGGK